MKHSVISLLLALICTLCINSCTEENNSSRGKNVTKRIELTFTGEMDNISPWARFSIYTEDNGSFKYISDGDTTTVNNGLFQSGSTISINKRLYLKEIINILSTISI